MSHSTDQEPQSPDSAMDYPEHNKTFDLFISLLKWGTGATVLVLFLMAIFLL
ncbi:MAG: aa3-type cytochrome c oxidase subunit IV [Pseudomonadota bacterium]